MSRQVLRVIDADAVRSLLPAADAAAAMATALIAHSRGASPYPRTTVEHPGGNGAVLLMPALSPSSEAFAVKLITMFHGAAEAGLPGVQGLIVLVDAVRGNPLALIDGASVTQIRTAAVTAVATDRLARADARILAVIGAGVQARGHVEALATIRAWQEIRLHSRTRARAERLREELAECGIVVGIADSAQDATRGADVICTTTSADSPVFTMDAVADRGVHVSAIGAFGARRREVPGAYIAQARAFVECREATWREAGDLMIARDDGMLGLNGELTELGEVLDGRRAGRTDDAELTLFKSVGLPIEDAAAAELIYRRAVAAGVGIEVPFP